jgi:hypothetical protein
MNWFPELLWIFIAALLLSGVFYFLIRALESRPTRVLKTASIPAMAISKKGRIIFCNPAAAKLLGSSVTEVCKSVASDTVSRFDSAELNQCLTAFLDLGIIERPSIFIQIPGSEEYLAELISQAKANGNPTLLILFVKLSSGILSVINHRTNAAIGTKVHDLKTNLSINQMALQNIQFLLDEHKNSPQVAEFITAAEQALKESAAGCTEIGYLTHTGALHFRSADLPSLVRSALDDEVWTLQVRCEFEEPIPPLSLDEVAISYIIRKLLKMASGNRKRPSLLRIYLKNTHPAEPKLYDQQIVQFDINMEMSQDTDRQYLQSFDALGRVSAKTAHDDILLISGILRNHGTDLTLSHESDGSVSLSFMLPIAAKD